MWKNNLPVSAEQPSGASRSSQRAWDRPYAQYLSDNILQAAVAKQDIARLKAARTHWSGAWLQAAPLANIGLKMDDNTIRVAAGLRLGAPITTEHTCVCSARVYSNGHHGLSCQRSAGRLARHNAINELLLRAFRSAGITAVREPPGLLRTDNKRPDGLTIMPWRRGKCLLWDTTCPDTFAPSHVDESALESGAAAEKADKNKRVKYA